jgi:hypothetical protein
MSRTGRSNVERQRLDRVAGRLVLKIDAERSDII